MDEEKDLVKTRALTELEELKSDSDDLTLPGVDNPEFVDSEEVTKEFQEEELKEEPKKENLITKFKKLPKKTKIIIIVSGVLVLLLIMGLILFFVLRKPKNTEEETPKEDVILNESNYTYKNGVLTILDREGNPVGDYTCKNQDEELCYLAFYDNALDDFNTLTIYKEDQVLRERSTNYQDLAFIYDNEKSLDGEIILYNLKDSEELGTYNSIKKVNEELVIVKENDKYKAVSLKNNEVNTVIDDNYTYMAYEDDFKTDAIVAGKNGTYTLVDYKGKELTSKYDNNIVMYNKSYVVLRNKNAYKLVNYQNEEVITDSEYILLQDDYLVSIENQKLYLKSYEGLTYNLDGLRLTSRNYKGSRKYDKDNKFVEEEIPFTLEKNTNTVYVTIDKESKAIDLLEGENSKNKLYYSYYDGKLYFYEDEAKTSLIGSYPCKNKNTFDKVDGNFNSCDVATQTSFSNNYRVVDNSEGMVPIFFNRYVFISDNSKITSNDNKVIYLYDLKNKRELAKNYNAIELGINTGFGFIDENVDVLARNTSGKLGMITLTRDGISAAYRSDYNFKAEAMERFGTNEVIVKYNGKWSILDKNDNLKGSFTDKIMDYYQDNYYLISSGNKVVVKDKSDKEIDSTKYDYVKLDNNVYAYVTGNTVGVKTYNGEELVFSDTNATTKDIVLKDYKNNLKVSFDGTNGVLIAYQDGAEIARYNFTKKIAVSTPDEPSEPEEEPNTGAENENQE